MRAWLRALALAGAGVGLLGLSGCEVMGSVDVRATEVFVDVVISPGVDDSPNCGVGLALPQQLQVSRTQTVDGVLTCRYRGTLDTGQLASLGIVLDHVGEYLTLTRPPGLVPARRFPGAGVTIDVLDLAVSFPGAVQDGLGTSGGAVARLVDPGQLRPPAGGRLVALDHPGPPWWMVAGGLGALVGAGGVGVASAVRRRGRPGHEDDSAGPGEGSELQPVKPRTTEAPRPAVRSGSDDSLWEPPETPN